jgi:hypothetical protein
MDISSTLAPKSNQFNADDLIAGPVTITVSKVSAGNAEQPVAIHFEGDNGKPWYPCKSMRRVLVAAWGADASAYIGRRITLYRDPEVSYGGIKVGGIRISHLSDLDNPLSIALTVTRQKRAPYKVQPLPPAPAPVAPQQQDTSTLIAAAYAACADAGLSDDGLIALVAELSNGEAATLDKLPVDTLQRLARSGVSAQTVARCNATAPAADDPDDLPATWAASA